LVRQALKISPKKRASRNSGQPIFIREICAGLVSLVKKKEGLPITREPSRKNIGGLTAYKRVKQIMKKRCYPVSESQIERWYGEYRKK
jgi:hypothetical protein